MKLCSLQIFHIKRFPAPALLSVGFYIRIDIKLLFTRRKCSCTFDNYGNTVKEKCTEEFNNTMYRPWFFLYKSIFCLLGKSCRLTCLNDVAITRHVPYVHRWAGWLHFAGHLGNYLPLRSAPVGGQLVLTVVRSVPSVASTVCGAPASPSRMSPKPFFTFVQSSITRSQVVLLYVYLS